MKHPDAVAFIQPAWFIRWQLRNNVHGQSLKGEGDLSRPVCLIAGAWVGTRAWNLGPADANGFGPRLCPIGPVAAGPVRSGAGEFSCGFCFPRAAAGSAWGGTQPRSKEEEFQASGRCGDLDDAGFDGGALRTATPYHTGVFLPGGARDCVPQEGSQNTLHSRTTKDRDGFAGRAF
ncbi:MAG: hypothetical protein K0Q55_2253 [Verrucomicrobia bacterium]|jgi:hypothetical protein|nr:hypothetical protein [Verrucomicrobiota bacterium]